MVCRWLFKAAWEVTRVFVGYEVDAGDRGLEVLEFEPTRPPVVVAEDVRFESERHDLFRGRLVGGVAMVLQVFPKENQSEGCS